MTKTPFQLINSRRHVYLHKTTIMETITPEILVFTISGGVGKNIAATAVVEGLKDKYPDSKIVILTAWTDVWLFNPNVYRVYNFSNAPYFYDTYIKDKNVKVFALEPYQTEGYILKNEHLVTSWFKLCGMEYNGQSPKLYFNSRELEYVSNNFVRNRHIFLIQTNGGSNPNNKYSWVRDMPLNFAQDIADTYAKAYTVIQVRRDDQLALANTEQFKGNLRELFALIKLSELRLFIDSSCAHAAAALEKKSTVLWVKNTPDVLGWGIHDNIQTEATNDLPSVGLALLDEYNIEGNIQECPFKEGTELFNFLEVTDSLNKQNK